MRMLVPLALAAALVAPAAGPAPAVAQQPTRAQTAPVDTTPFVVEYYYRTRWGTAAEFIRLFRKNHMPVLQAGITSGRILSVTGVAPRYHATEDGRWDYRVTIVFRNVRAAFGATPEEDEAVIRRLFPDRATFDREEQRRFEILEAHWDVPITPVDLRR